MVISDSKHGQQDGAAVNMRREKDVRRLFMSQYDVQLTNEDDTKDFRVVFYGPKDSPYEGVSNSLTNNFLIRLAHVLIQPFIN